MKKEYSGPLILVVGNSGSGKDSIISGVIKKYPSNLKKIYLARRYITRPPSEFEENYSITPEEFDIKESEGDFVLKWRIYGLAYGVPLEIEKWLEKGHPVIVNVSRMIIDEAREIYDDLKVVFIEVALEITIKRLKERGREKGVLLEQRIERAKANQKLPVADFTVDNSGKLEEAVDDFLNFLISIMTPNP